MYPLLYSFVVVTLILSSTTSDAASNCAAKAVDASGKALEGAAKDKFIKLCESDSAEISSCEASAVDSKVRALQGAARHSKVKKCLAEAKK